MQDRDWLSRPNDLSDEGVGERLAAERSHSGK